MDAITSKYLRENFFSLVEHFSNELLEDMPFSFDIEKVYLRSDELISCVSINYNKGEEPLEINIQLANDLLKVCCYSVKRGRDIYFDSDLEFVRLITRAKETAKSRAVRISWTDLSEVGHYGIRLNVGADLPCFYGLVAEEFYRLFSLVFFYSLEITVNQLSTNLFNEFDEFDEF